MAGLGLDQRIAGVRGFPKVLNNRRKVSFSRRRPAGVIPGEAFAPQSDTDGVRMELARPLRNRARSTRTCSDMRRSLKQSSPL